MKTELPKELQAEIENIEKQIETASDSIASLSEQIEELKQQMKFKKKLLKLMQIEIDRIKNNPEESLRLLKLKEAYGIRNRFKE